VSQPRTVEAMYKANWPAQGRSTDAEQAAPKMAATRGLEGVPPQEEGAATAHGRTTDAEQASLKTAATRGLEGVRPREERVASPSGPGAIIECG
jgi:hypothetical protein